MVFAGDAAPTPAQDEGLQQYLPHQRRCHFFRRLATKLDFSDQQKSQCKAIKIVGQWPNRFLWIC
jgi:hypothetical protein